MLYSYPVYIGSVERRSKNKEGNFEMLKLPRPSAVENYNKIMGGTDLGDQLGSYKGSSIRRRNGHIEYLLTS